METDTLPIGYATTEIEAKNCFLDALTTIDLAAEDKYKPSAISLYYVSTSFEGTSAAQGEILITRTFDALANALIALFATLACYLGLSAIGTRLIGGWSIFVNAQKRNFSKFQLNHAEDLKNLLERLQWSISSFLSNTMRQGKRGIPTTQCLQFAQYLQQHITGDAQFTHLLSPLPTSIAALVHVISPSKAATLNAHHFVATPAPPPPHLYTPTPRQALPPAQVPHVPAQIPPCQSPRWNPPNRRQNLIATPVFHLPLNPLLAGHPALVTCVLIPYGQAIRFPLCVLQKM